MKKTSLLIFILFFFYSYIQSADDPATRPYFIGRIKKYAKKRTIEKLFKASEKGDINSLNTLLAKGVDVNVRGDRHEPNGWDDDNVTPLMQATRFQHVAIVRRLLEAGADVNAQSASVYGGNFSALDWAVRTKNQTIFKLHIASKPNRAILSDAVLTAVSSNNTEVIPTLLENGASTDKRNRDLQTPLMIAARYRSALIAKQLLADQTIQIDAQEGGTGKTALMYAVSSSKYIPGIALSINMYIATMLLYRDADVTIKNEEGLTAYDFAQEGRHHRKGCAEIVQLLKERMQPMVKSAARPAVPVVLDVD